jgi:catechol 2,3-dioxygenase-like lactoylglutathione lyase family enzyme
MNHPPISEQITFVYVRDLNSTHRFYADALGLSLVLDQGGCRIYATAGDAYLGFCQRKVPPGAGAGLILTLVTPEVDAWYERLRSAGLEFVKEPAVNQEYGIYHCFLRDPDGYLVEIQRFLDEGALSGQ